MSQSGEFHAKPGVSRLSWGKSGGHLPAYCRSLLGETGMARSHDSISWETAAEADPCDRSWPTESLFHGKLRTPPAPADSRLDLPRALGTVTAVADRGVRRNQLYRLHQRCDRDSVSLLRILSQGLVNAPAQCRNRRAPGDSRGTPISPRRQTQGAVRRRARSRRVAVVSQETESICLEIVLTRKEESECGRGSS